MAAIGKENNNIRKKLQGEYRSFAGLLIKNIVSKCEIDDFSRESVKELLLILAEGQSAGKPFNEIVSEPNETIHGTVNTLKPKPKKYFIKLTASFFIASAALVFAVLFFSLWIPVVLGKPDVRFEEAGGYIVWRPVQNAREYEITVDGTVRGTTEENYFDMTAYIGSEEFTVTVKPLGKGRYKTKNSSVGNYTGKLEGRVFTADYNTYDINGFDLENGYCGFVHCEVEPDKFNRFIIKYTPKYNGYYKIDSFRAEMLGAAHNGSDIEFDCKKEIIGGGEEAYTTRVYLTAGDNYFTFSYKNEISFKFYVTFNLCMFNPEDAYTLGPGITVFASYWDYIVKYGEAYSAQDGITFNYITTDKNVYTLEYSTMSLSDFQDGHLLAVNNAGNKPTELKLTKSSACVNGESGVLKLKRGYTTIEYGNDIEFSDNQILSFYTLNQLVLIQTTADSRLRRVIYAFGGEWYSGFQIVDKNKKICTTVFCDEDIELEYVYGEIPVISLFSGSGDITVPFGFFKIDTGMNISVLRTQTTLYIFSPFDNSNFAAGSYILIPGNGYFFNALKEPFTVIISKVTVT